MDVGRVFFHPASAPTWADKVDKECRVYIGYFNKRGNEYDIASNQSAYFLDCLPWRNPNGNE